MVSLYWPTYDLSLTPVEGLLLILDLRYFYRILNQMVLNCYKGTYKKYSMHRSVWQLCQFSFKPPVSSSLPVSSSCNNNLPLENLCIIAKQTCTVV